MPGPARPAGPGGAVPARPSRGRSRRVPAAGRRGPPGRWAGVRRAGRRSPVEHLGPVAGVDQPLAGGDLREPDAVADPHQRAAGAEDRVLGRRVRARRPAGRAGRATSCSASTNSARRSAGAGRRRPPPPAGRAGRSPLWCRMLRSRPYQNRPSAAGRSAGSYGGPERHPRPGVELDLEARLRRAGRGDRPAVDDQLQPARRAGQRLVPQPGHQRLLLPRSSASGADQRDVDVAAARLVRAQSERAGGVRADQVVAEHVAGGGDQVGEVAAARPVHMRTPRSAQGWAAVSWSAWPTGSSWNVECSIDDREVARPGRSAAGRASAGRARRGSSCRPRRRAR